MTWSWPAAALGLALGCGSTEGPLLRARDAGMTPDAEPTASPSPTSPAEGPLAPDANDPGNPGLRAGMRLHYQITGTPDVTANADVYVLDLFDSERAQLTALHDAGRITIAYFSAGSYEPWRVDAAAFPDETRGEPLARYPNERWLDIRHADVQRAMQARLELARDKGFDGVFPGALNGQLAESGFALEPSDQLAYDRWLAGAAHTLGLTPGLSDFGLASELADVFDWAIDSGCIAADSCSRLDPLLAKGKAVFSLEVSSDAAETCARAAELGIDVVLKRAGSDAWSESCP